MTSVNPCTALMVVPKTDAQTYKALAAQGGTSSAKVIAPVVNDTVEINGAAKKIHGGELKKAVATVKDTAYKAKQFICKNNKNKVIAGAIAAVGVAAAAFGIFKGVQAHNNKVQAHQA